MEQVNDWSTKLEKRLEAMSVPVKPYIPTIARFLLVVTFLEDAIRITTQWDLQTKYLKNYRGFGDYGFAEFFLFVNVSLMTVGSCLAIARKHSEIAVGGLFGVMVAQTIGYGLVFDFSFFLRNLSVAGGLLMLLAEASSKRKSLFAGLPSLSETDKSTYLQLFGRILLVFLFISFSMNGEFSLLRVAVSVIALIGCIMVVIGFKAKMTAWFLVTFLCISNVVLNNWWSLHHNHPRRDFLKYDFFQTLSIMGGFLLLANLGAGEYSYDEKKKNF